MHNNSREYLPFYYYFFFQVIPPFSFSMSGDEATSGRYKNRIKLIESRGLSRLLFHYQLIYYINTFLVEL